ncbi:hypothetical protein [Hymenobacter defluvii]|uniref:Uncharacterized protein n=1 Tax=Hymenobacter defluvii TaxID=2054411 RepID=A0ABS3TAU0_9BACT|nr:hypothetical protein [Hymenobacter defluvii]MBO3270770.1 hypothetical protein [Hymenobacter defluvii]
MILYDTQVVKGQFETMSAFDLRGLRSSRQEDELLCRLIDRELEFRADVCSGILDTESMQEYLARG